MKRMTKTFLEFLRINPLLYGVLFIFALGTELVPLASGLLIRNIFDSLEMNQPMYFLIYVTLFSVILLGQQVMRYQYGMIDAKIIFETDRFHIFKTLQKILIYGKELSIGKVMDIFNIDLQAINYQGMSMIDLISKFIFLISTIVVMFLNGALITGIVIIPFIGANILLVLGEHRFLVMHKEQRDNSLEYFDCIHGVIENSSSFRYFDNTYFYKKLGQMDSLVQKIAIKKEVYLQFLRAGVGVINQIVVIGLIIMSYRQGISVGTLIMFMTYMGSAFNFSLLLNTVLNSQSQLRVYEEKAKEIHEEVIKLTEGEQSVSEIEAMVNAQSQSVGVVLSDFYLFDESVVKNIELFSGKDATQEEIIKALEVARFPLDKLNLESIGANGIKLSAGERQRLAIARALASGEFIIFDMDFENIDEQTRDEIMDGLGRLNKKYVKVGLS